MPAFLTKHWRSAVKYLGYFVALLLLILSVGLFYINTDAGKNTLVERANSYFKSHSDQIKIGPITGSIFSGFTLTRIAISDEQGLWLDIRNADINWSPFALLTGLLNIEKAKVQSAQLYRLPTTKQGAEEKSPISFALPTLPISINVADFEATNIEIGVDLVGHRAKFWGGGALHYSKTGDLLLKTELIGLGKAKDKITVDFAYPQETSELSADIFIEAPKGGVFGYIVGISAEHDVTASFQGAGPLNDWSGTLSAQIDTTQIADAKLQITGTALSLRANLNAGEFIPDTGAALLGRKASLALDINATNSENTKNVSLELIANTIRLNGTGSLNLNDLTATDTVNFSAEIIDVRPFNRLSAPVRFEPFKFTGTLRDIWSSPKVTAVIDTLSVTDEANLAAVIKGQVEAAFNAQDIDINAAVSITDISGAAVSQLKPLINSGLRGAFSATIDRENFGARVDNLTLENPTLKISGTGEIVGDAHALNSKITIAITDIADVVPNASGPVGLYLKVQQDSADAPLHAMVQMNSAGLLINEATLSELIGLTPSVSAQLQRWPDGALKMTKLAFDGALVSLKGTADISDEQIITDSEFHLALTNLKKIESLKGLVLQGGINVAGTLSGPVASPSIALATHMTTLDLQTLKLSDLEFQATAHTILSTLQGNIRLHGGSNIGDLNTEVVLARDQNGTFTVPSFNVALGHYHATGSATRPVGSPVTGSISVVTSSVNSSGTNSFGNIDAQIRFTDEEGRQQIEMVGTLADGEFPTDNTELLTINKGTVTAKALLLETTPQITGNVKLSGLSHPQLQAQKIDASVTPFPKGQKFNIEAQGTKQHPYDFKIKGDWANQLDGQHVSLSLDGTIDETLVQSNAPLEVFRSAKEFSIKPFSLALGTGQISGAVFAKDQTLHMDFKARQANLKPVHVFFPDTPVTGIVDGVLNLDAANGVTNGSFDVTVSDISADGGATVLDQALRFAIKGDVSNNTVSITSTAHLSEIMITRIEGTVPLMVDAEPFNITIPMDKPVKGQLAWKGNIDTIWPLFELVNHELGGNVDAALNLSGTLSQPDVDGYITLKGGRYENAQTGFVAANIALESAIVDRHLVINSLTAADGNSGIVEAAGSILMQEDFSFDAEASLKLEKAHLVRRPKLDVTASTTLKLVKKGTKATLTGDVTVDNANVGAVIQDQSEILVLDVREINGEKGTAVTSTLNQIIHLTPLGLDVNFHAPGKLFIRSYGLDSEWSSRLKITGSSLEPKVTGSATLIHGTFDFSGKRFSLTRGSLTFHGDKKNDPLLDISAEYQLPDLTAILTIGGTASAPTLEVNSNPSLPQDEILSRILFGTSATSLSPIEAVQLAAAVHSFTNGGGQGLIGGVRRKIGIDRLTIDQAEGRDYGTTITGGKYLTNNIYVEVTTAPTTGETATSVEVGLTKNLSLITRQTMDHDSNLAIRWSWNY